MKNTEAIYYGENYYKWYPKIREEDIGKDTSNMFIDTLNICNLILPIIVGDYELVFKTIVFPFRTKMR